MVIEVYKEADNKLIMANIKLQDENKELKFINVQNKELISRIKTYIEINKDQDDKVNADSILEIIGENYE